MGTSNFDDIDITGAFSVNGVAVNPSATTAVVAGTVSASKAAVVDASKDITGFRNITATGAIQGATLVATASVTTVDLAVTGVTNIGNAAGDKVTFHGASAQSGAQAALVVDASDLATAITLVNALKAMAINHGLMSAT